MISVQRSITVTINDVIDLLRSNGHPIPESDFKAVFVAPDEYSRERGELIITWQRQETYPPREVAK